MRFGEAPYRESAYGETLPGEVPYGEGPYGETPYGETLPGEGPYGEGPYGETPYGEAPYGVAPYGESAYSESPYAEGPYGEAPYGEGPYSESSYGETLPAEAPYGEGPYGESPYGEASYGETGYELESPFLTGASLAEVPASESPLSEQPGSELESPFLSSFGSEPESDHASEAFGELLAELEDEQFDAAVAQLVDEASALHLGSQVSFSSAEAAPSLATGELEAWLSPLSEASDRLLSEMGSRLSSEELETLRDTELDTLLESMRPMAGYMPEAFENFLGGLFNKAKSLVKGVVNVAKKGIQAVGRVLPIGWLFDKLRDLVKPLLRGVLQRAIGLLPVTVQPLARQLASRLFREAEAQAALEPEGDSLAREFDINAARVALASSESEAEAVVSEAEAESQSVSNAIHDLDAARARFAQQVIQLPPGQAPVAELEQFLPVIMALRPALKLGLSIIGRDKVVHFLADKLAGLLRGLVGDAAARLLSGPIVDVGLRLLTGEAPMVSEGPIVAGEALASTVEDTVREVMELPAEAFEDTVRLEAEIQQSFAEAAARYIPAERLRPDLPELETSTGGGVWVLMPRAARPSYRYKKFSRVFVVPITRQMARALPTGDAGTVETMLLDRGIRVWPAEAEVHLYETLPGSTLGHIGQFESQGETMPGEVISELQPLTPEAASMLVREPALGRPHPHHDGHHADGSHVEPYAAAPDPYRARGMAPGGRGVARRGSPLVRRGAAYGSSGNGSPLGARTRTVTSASIHVSPPPVAPSAAPAPSGARPLPPGMRLYRIRVPGARRPVARPRHRIRVQLDGTVQPPAIRVHLHLGEREAQQLGERLRDLPRSLLIIRQHFHHVMPAILTARLMAKGASLLRRPVTPRLAVRLSLLMTEAMTQAVSRFLRTGQAEITRAIQDRTQGITLTFVFRAERPDLAAARVHPPTVTVRSGWHA
jgi:hypothetical protein